MSTATRSVKRPPLWRNVTALKWAAQLAVLAAVILFFRWIYGNFVENLGQEVFDFKILSDPAALQLEEGFTTLPETGAEALLVGIVNTLKVSLTGIVAATILGLVIGIARLSSNWLVSKIASAYVEAFRNVPLLVQILFWGWVILLLPRLTGDGGPLPGWAYASNRGLAFAFLFPADGFWQWVAFLIAGGIAARYVYRRRARRRALTGRETYELSSALGTFFLFGVVGWFAHPLVGFLGFIWAALASVFRGFPVVVLQVLLAAVSLGLAGRWIRRLLSTKRSGGGVTVLSDDDWYRMVFTGLVSLGIAAAVLVYSGISRGILRLFAVFFEFLDGAFVGAGSAPLEFSRPGIEASGPTGLIFTYADGGFLMSPAFVGIWIGVTLYTAAFIGEAVRAGILAVPKGQTEAGLAAGLTRSQLLRLVVLPQAVRVIIPPLGNQYLNLAKNTSLGLAVGYLEIVGIGRILSAHVGSQAAVAVLWIGFYLALSLLMSTLINWYNRRVQLVEH